MKIKKKFRKGQWVKTVQETPLVTQSSVDWGNLYCHNEHFTHLGLKAGMVGQITGTPYHYFDGYFTVFFEFGDFVMTRDVKQDDLERAKIPK